LINLLFTFFISFSNLSRSDDVLLKPIIVAPASANAIEQARPKPLPAPVTRAYLFLRLIFFKYHYLAILELNFLEKIILIASGFFIFREIIR